MSGQAGPVGRGISAGADKHAGVEGKTSLGCCDANVAVVKVWDALNTFLQAPHDTPLLLLLAKLRCPVCQRLLPTFNIITTLSSVDVRRLQQRISIAAQDALEQWPEDATTELLKNGTSVLTKEPWINVQPLFQSLTTVQLQTFLLLHRDVPAASSGAASSSHQNGNVSKSPQSVASSDGSLSQFQSDQKRVKTDDAADLGDQTRSQLMAQITSNRRCRDTIKQAAWGVASSALLASVRKLLRRELERGELFQQALILEGAQKGEGAGKGESKEQSTAATKQSTVAATGAASGAHAAQVTKANDDGNADVDETPAPGGLTALSGLVSSKGGFVKGTGYAGDARLDAQIAKRARKQQAEVDAATATVMRHAVDALNALAKACLKRDEIMPTFMAAPHAVLVEGGLAHCLHAMLTHQPLDSLVSTPQLLEAELRLLNTVLLTAPLQPILLMPAGLPPVASDTHATRVACCGYGPEGPSVQDAVDGVDKAAEHLKDLSMECNEVNEDGLHVGIDSMLQLTLYINSTASRLKEAVEDIDEMVDLPPAPAHALAGDDAPGAGTTNSGPSGAPTATPQQQLALERALRKVGVVYAPLLHCHALRHQAQSFEITSATAKKRIRDVTKAVTALEGQLPINWESSVHVAIDETRPDMFRVLVLPGQETPYANGAFLFDFLLPEDFPNKPPKAKFLTTGGGTVRFNPNLYNCGKVCLSLLGTWSGPSWDPATSTILQVLVSLQAMVFCKDPFFNEPGYERDAGTSKGDTQTKKYNQNIIHQTLRHAILAPLTRPLAQPHSPFRDILTLHWTHKRETILAQLDAAKETLKGVAGADSVLADVRKQLETFEERNKQALKQEAEEKAAEEAAEKARLEHDEKERMFQRMQDELAMQQGNS